MFSLIKFIEVPTLRCFLPLAFASLAIAPVNAMTIDPQCTKMTNKIACTCALENGGHMSSDGKRWLKGASRRGAVSPAFDKCMQDNGGNE